MTDSEHSETAGDRKRGSLQIYTVWLMLAVCCYLGPFGLLALDHFVFERRLIETPLRTYDPDLAEKIGEVIRVVYWPMRLIMRTLNLIPGP